MSESYPNNSTKIGDKYALKTGKAYKIRDIMVVTGNVVSNRAEIDKMGAAYTTDQVIGVMENNLDLKTVNSPFLPFPYDEATLLVEGPSSAIVAEDVKANDLLQGASDQITQTFSGDGTAQQTVTVDNVPIDSVVSFIEDTPTVLTRVALPAVPGLNEYSLNDITGELIIGGTSVSGTDNYTLIFNVDSGRLEKLVEEKDETLAVSTDTMTATEPIDIALEVESLAGTLTGIFTVQYSGTPASGAASVNRATGVVTFAAADVVTSARILYKTKNKSCARALEDKNAGEICNIFFNGVDK